jgi:drug/metabolite transporter (DMT)-like permease
MLMAAYIVLVLIIGKLIWYEGLKRLRVIDAVALIGAGPAFSLLFAILFLGERPNVHQGLGFLLIVSGVYLVTHPSARHHSVQE